MSRLLGPEPDITYVTAATLAANWRVPLAEVYRRAYRAKWRKVHTRPVGYLVLDVLLNDGSGT